MSNNCYFVGVKEIRAEHDVRFLKVQFAVGEQELGSALSAE